MRCRNVPSATKQSEIDLKLRLSFEFPLSCVFFREIASVTLATKWRAVNRCNIKCNSGTCLKWRFSNKMSENQQDSQVRKSLAPSEHATLPWYIFTPLIYSFLFLIGSVCLFIQRRLWVNLSVGLNGNMSTGDVLQRSVLCTVVCCAYVLPGSVLCTVLCCAYVLPGSVLCTVVCCGPVGLWACNRALSFYHFSKYVTN